MRKPGKNHLKWLTRTGLLTETLPYMRAYNRQIVVVKYGGNAMADTKLTQAFISDIAMLRQIGVRPMIVHGGGPQIDTMLDRLRIEKKRVDGLRVTDKPTMEIVEMVLAGNLNGWLVSQICASGTVAVGLNGKDGDFLKCQRHPALGLVGKPVEVDASLLTLLLNSPFIPVVAPLGVDIDTHETLNVNADVAAGAIASALGAKRLIMVTDVPGVMDENETIIPELGSEQTEAMIRNQTISGGMIPKVQTCLDAIRSGVGGAAIVDGRAEHVLLVELFTNRGAGTLFVPPTPA